MTFTMILTYDKAKVKFAVGDQNSENLLVSFRLILFLSSIHVHVSISILHINCVETVLLFKKCLCNSYASI